MHASKWTLPTLAMNTWKSRWTHFWAIGVRICFISSMMLSTLSGLFSRTFSIVGHTEDWKQNPAVTIYSEAHILKSNKWRSSSRGKKMLYLADLERVSIKLLCKHESLGEDGLVVVSVLNHWRSLWVSEHLSDLPLEGYHHFCDLLLAPDGAQADKCLIVLTLSLTEYIKRIQSTFSILLNFLGFNCYLMPYVCAPLM